MTGISWNLVWTVISALIVFANGYLILRLKSERNQTQKELLEFETRLLKELNGRFVGRREWEALMLKIDENAKIVKDEVASTREHYHELVNTLISKTVQGVTETLSRKREEKHSRSSD